MSARAVRLRVTHKGTLARHPVPAGERCPLSGEPIVAPAATRPVVDVLLRMVPPAPTQGRSRSQAAAVPAGTRFLPACPATADVAVSRPSGASRPGPAPTGLAPTSRGKFVATVP
jgi:hypothetical protein